MKNYYTLINHEADTMLLLHQNYYTLINHEAGTMLLLHQNDYTLINHEVVIYKKRIQMVSSCFILLFVLNKI